MIASKAFYQLTTDIKSFLLDNGVTKTVTYGDLGSVALEKQTIFPLCHLNVDRVSINSNIMVFSLTLLSMDIVYDRIEASELSNDDNRFTGTDNEQDVLNTQLWVCNNLVANMLRGDIRDDGYELVNTPICEPFTDRFTHRLSGWAMPFELNVKNDISAC